jgi:hypothetical protein
MIARRKFLLGASATLLSAPAIVRVASLMQVRGITFPIERHYYGFVERLYVHSFLPEITRLQNAGLSALGIAADFNSRGITIRMNGDREWDAQHVMFVIRKNDSIRREDAIHRAERMLAVRNLRLLRSFRASPR